MSLTDLKYVCHLKLLYARIKLKGGFIVPFYITVTWILNLNWSNLKSITIYVIVALGSYDAFGLDDTYVFNDSDNLFLFGSRIAPY